MEKIGTDCLELIPTAAPSWGIFSRISYWIKSFLYKKDESNLYRHAKRELKLLGMDADVKEEDPNKWMAESVLELLKIFAKQGHSGSSAPYCVSFFKSLALFEPLCPLRGTDDEWNEIGEGVWQNNRCSHVFKDADGKAYDIDGRIFREPSGCCYTNFDSRVYVDFPYTPKSEYIDVLEAIE
jgi:hypothetical protein